MPELSGMYCPSPSLCLIAQEPHEIVSSIYVEVKPRLISPKNSTIVFRRLRTSCSRATAFFFFVATGTKLIMRTSAYFLDSVRDQDSELSCF